MGISFLKGKKVFLTGHTGFKGSWLCKILLNEGVDLLGYSLPLEGNEILFELSGNRKNVNSVYGDIRHKEKLFETIDRFKPEIIIHMAAQPLVQEGYADPLYTYEVNVNGTLNLLESVRKSESVKCLLNVTTDKVYKNEEWEWGYRETDFLDGYDPYANSKSCSELVTRCYKDSFLSGQGVLVSTVRSGNVIGGGDFSKNRIVPDCVRAMENNTPIHIRNPYSIRPYQHVLDSLMAYLLVIKKQYESPEFCNNYNVGPDEFVTNGELVDLFCKYWGNGASWETVASTGVNETKYLKLDCSRIKGLLNWEPVWNIEQAVEKTIEWTKDYFEHSDIEDIMDRQISSIIENCLFFD